MTFSPFQISFAVLIALALIYGRPHRVVVSAVLVNFIGSVAISKSGMGEVDQLIWAGTLDLTCAIAMLGGFGWRANISAACYGAMAVAYPIGLSLDATMGLIYSVVEALGLIALAVIGGLDSGIRTLYRRLRPVYRSVSHGFRRLGAVGYRPDNGDPQ